MPLVIGLGGSAGAIARYLVDGVVAERTGGEAGDLAAATLNVADSVALGVAAVVAGLTIGRLL